MMYPFFTLDDNTEITYSAMQRDGTVKAYIETPDETDGFHDATCFLPEHRWVDVHGYSGREMMQFKQIIRNNAHLIKLIVDRSYQAINRNRSETK